MKVNHQQVHLYCTRKGVVMVQPVSWIRLQYVYCINFQAIWQYVCSVWKWTISWFIYTVQEKGWSWYNQLHESDCSVFTVSMIIMNKPRDHWSLSPPLPVIYIVYRMLGGRGGWGLFRISGGLSCVRVVRGVLYIKTNLKLVYRKFCY